MKRSMLKKLLSLTLLFILIFSISGCYMGTSAKEREQGRKTGLKIIEDINDKDTNSIVQQFSKNVQDNFDLEKELEDFYAFLGSDIKSYGRLQSQDIEGWYDNGKLTHSIICVTIYDVVTKDGTKYDKLSLTYMAVDKDKDKVGVEKISLINDSKEVAAVGGFLE